MKNFYHKIFALGAACLLIGSATLAADQKAVDKESANLVAEGKTLLQNDQPTDALWSFRKAAKVGNVEGAFAAGNLLLQQARSSSGRDRILKFSESIGFLFFAATNHSAPACAALSVALQNGIGVQSNLVAAYAWMKMAVQFDPAFKSSLDRLVIRLEPGDVHQAQDLADEYRLGRWSDGLVRPVDEQDARLAVQGFSLGGRKSLVVVNSTTFAVGDTQEVYAITGSNKRTAANRLTVRCLEIGADYVLVAIGDEANLKLLSISQISRR